ncbi:hypothetical protein LJC61_04980 [Ruminococcaceae bacterium OttesenSCG-928-A16]|nr:hypothetical protein [Ruminococcaceae bacterium OttesenSCG-928-A16]
MKKLFFAAVALAAVAYLLLLFVTGDVALIVATVLGCLAGLAVYIGLAMLVAKKLPQRQQSWVWALVAALLAAGYFLVVKPFNMAALLAPTPGGHALFVLGLVLLVLCYGAGFSLLWAAVKGVIGFMKSLFKQGRK